MTETEALHTAARRYCMNRTAELKTLSDIVKKWGVYHNEMNLGPREALVEALQLGVETIVYDDMSIEECRDRIIEAALTTENDITTCKSWRDQGVRERTQDERENLAAYIRHLDTNALLQIEPLPFRRVLTDTESVELRQRLMDQWQFDDGWWIPERPIELTEEVLVARSSVFTEHVSDEEIKHLLRDHGIEKLFRVCFYGEDPDFEVDIDSFKIVVEWSEQVWTTAKMDWIIYIPQTWAVTVAGDWLVQEVKALWPQWEDHPFVASAYIPPPNSSSAPLTEEEKRAFNLSISFAFAASTENIVKMEELLIQGATVNLQHQGKPTDLHTAAVGDKMKSALFLIEHGANVDATWGGVTPLMQAVANGYVAMIRLLMDAGADVNLRATDVSQNGLRAGLTALEIAEKSEYLKMLEGGRRREEILKLLREKK
jgi:hypothetical protein